MRTSVVLCAVTLASVAHADDVGQACTTSDECAGLKCIAGSCTTVERALQSNEDAPLPATFFGNGHGYTARVVIADVAAMAFVPIAIVSGWAAERQNFRDFWPFVVANFPVVLTGPIVHLAHGRVGPGFISLFGWASVTATAEGLGALFAMSSCGESSCNDNTGRGGAIAIGIGLAGGGLMTALDAWMARSVSRAQRPGIGFAITPITRGAVLAIGGPL